MVFGRGHEMSGLRRFYIPPSESAGERYLLDPEESRHIRKVLRLKTGDMIELFNGEGYIFKAVISSFTGTGAEATLTGERELQPEPSLSITMIQAIPKSGKMETVIRMGTELGVSVFLPVISGRCGALPPQRLPSLVRRWENTALQACKQCGQSRLPSIVYPVGVPEAFTIKSDLKIIFSENHKNEPLPSQLKTGSIAVAVGPEGGWTEKELEAALSGGFVPCGLGPRILRAETAAVTALSLIQLKYGDLAAI